MLSDTCYLVVLQSFINRSQTRLLLIPCSKLKLNSNILEEIHNILHTDKQKLISSAAHWWHLRCCRLFERSTWVRQARGGTGHHIALETQWQLGGQLKSKHVSCVRAAQPGARMYEVSTTLIVTWLQGLTYCLISTDFEQAHFLHSNCSTQI